MSPLVIGTATARLGRADDGAAAVELAIILPVLLTMMFGIIEVGRLLHDYHVVRNSVQDAARFLGRVPVSCPNAGFGTVDAAHVNIAKNLVLTGAPANPSDGAYLLNYWTDKNAITITPDCVPNGMPLARTYRGAYRDLDFFPTIKVEANVPVNFLSGSLLTGTTGLTMKVTHHVTHIGN
jgi:TadE-like protein